MTDNNKTEIVVVLDRSGSMAGIQSDMEGGFDTLIREQRKALHGLDCRVTLVQFDNVYETVYANAPLAEVPPLKLEPRGGTALLDAIGRTIDETGARLKNTPEQLRPARVMVVIITDGGENCSHTYRSRSDIQLKVQHQREKYSWEFLYLGANQDAFAEAAKLGVIYAQNWTASAQGAICTNGLVYGAMLDYVTEGQLSTANQVLWTTSNQACTALPAEWSQTPQTPSGQNGG